MANSETYLERGISAMKGVVFTGFEPFLANAAINPNLLLVFDANGKVGPATAGSMKIAGVSPDDGVAAANDPIDVFWGNCRVIADSGDILAGYNLKAAANGTVTALIDSELAGDVIFTSAAGEAFANQPANDGVEVLSSDNDDVSDVTIIGTTTGTDTVVVEVVTLTGTTPAASVKTDWGVILAVKKEVTEGDITVQEASAGADIVVLPAAETSAGVETVGESAFNVAPTVVASDTTTKQIGMAGTNSAGTTIYDSQALNNTTAVTMNSAFRTITELYTGDLEATRTVNVALGAEEDDDLKVGRAQENQPDATSKFYAWIIP